MGSRAGFSPPQHCAPQLRSSACWHYWSRQGLSQSRLLVLVQIGSSEWQFHPHTFGQVTQLHRMPSTVSQGPSYPTPKDGSLHPKSTTLSQPFGDEGGCPWGMLKACLSERAGNPTFANTRGPVPTGVDKTVEDARQKEQEDLNFHKMSADF